MARDGEQVVRVVIEVGGDGWGLEATSQVARLIRLEGGRARYETQHDASSDAEELELPLEAA